MGQIKVAILGAGAMGSLFGGFLSQHNRVWLIDVDRDKVDTINREGVTILSGGERLNFRPQALVDTSGLATVDLIIVFVKAMYSQSALLANKHLIGEDTCVMTLQNGAGHEDILSRFVPWERLILGTTEHNGSVTEEGEIHHGGGGPTYIGLVGTENEILPSIAGAFTQCGIQTAVTDNIKEKIWRKLFVNASASVLTAALQVKLGYILDNEYAWQLAEELLREAVMVANADGQDFVLKDVVRDVRDLLGRVYEGYTSIYADLKFGRLTEVGTINGAVVKKAHRFGLEVPNHEFVTRLIHALERRNTNNR